MPRRKCNSLGIRRNADHNNNNNNSNNISPCKGRRQVKHLKKQHPHRLFFSSGFNKDLFLLGKAKIRKTPRKKICGRIYAVDSVLGKRVGADGKVDYLLKWADFSNEHNSWECAGNLDRTSLKEFRELENVILINETLAGSQSLKDIIILKDVPKKILNIRKDSINCDHEFLVEWSTETDLNWLPAYVLRESFPQLVIEFYERISYLYD
ncbi:chromobox protein homolog 5-like [Brevipalpus obovatus]|uniref:chromobox protein homolog 5-like n=1 Tax=Brevipalpus obovatus TaxID=246614 RepID=UPI003D9EABEE